MTCFEQIMREVVGLESTLVRKLLDSRLAALIEVGRVVTSLLEAADALSGEFPDLARRCGEMAADLTDAKGRTTIHVRPRDHSQEVTAGGWPASGIARARCAGESLRIRAISGLNC